MLPAGLLSVRSRVVSSLHTLCPKRFTLEAVSVRLRTVRWEKKLKHRRVGEKKFELLFGVEKKILSCNFWFVRWLVRIARVYFFVCGLFIIQVFQQIFSLSILKTH